MKRFLIAALLGILAPVAHGQFVGYTLAAQHHGGASGPSVAQTPTTCSAFTTSPTCTATFGSNLASGQILVAGIDCATTCTISAPTGCVTSWALFSSDNHVINTNVNSAVYIGTSNVTTACGVAMAGTSAGGVQLNAAVYSLTGAVATGDQANYAHTSFGTTVTGPTITNTVNNDINIVFVFGGGVAITGFNTPYTSDYTANLGGVFAGGAHLSPVTSGVASGAVWTNGTGGTYDCIIVSIEP
jgi:hypothetical protein